MILKQLLGEIMTEMGFVTGEQLDEALKRQKRLFEEKTLPERLERTRLVSEARKALESDTTALIGRILTDMELVTKEQLEAALKEQDKVAEVYETLESKKLGKAIEVGSVINSTLNLAEVLSLIMRHSNRVTNSAASALMLLDEKTGELVFSVPTGPKAKKLTDIRIPPGEGIAGWVVEHEKPVLVPDTDKDPRFYSKVDKLSGFDTKSVLCVPLKAKTKLIGVLEVINKADGTSFTEEDALVLTIFAYQAAMAIENARLHGELKARLLEEVQVQKSLAESEKFRALGQMASGVAHDFNNLLMGIQGNTSLLLFNTDPSHHNYGRLANIEESVQSGAELTKQLLGFAKGGMVDIMPTNLNQLIKRSAEMFGRTRKEVKIDKKFQKDVWTVEVDQGQLGQVLLNLQLNAWQAMPAGGNLFLRTENVTLAKNFVKPFDVEPGKYVKISVTDTGVGMDEVTQKRIFDPFFTTKEMGRGAGLGLASVYGIIKNHGGIIRIESEKGKGTTFEIYLPASEKAVRKDRKPAETVMNGTETVLIVDDEEMVIDVGKGMLEKLGYKVLMAKNGNEAIKLYQKNKKKIDLVILDMVMPDLGGGDTYDRLKEIDPKIRVLLSSGYSLEGQASEIMKRGCNGFIQKPFNIKQLSQKVRGVLV